jgi:hypothetical protein
MGTRSLTTFIEQWKDEKTEKVKQNKIVTLYRQMDGYPTGMGVDLAEFLASGKMVNGIGFNETQLVFSGMGCLAAQVVAHFKDGAGGYYLHRGGTINCWEEYRYEVIYDDDTKELLFKVIEIGYINDKGKYINKPKELFFGSPKEFLVSEVVLEK